MSGYSENKNRLDQNLRDSEEQTLTDDRERFWEMKHGNEGDKDRAELDLYFHTERAYGWNPTSTPPSAMNLLFLLGHTTNDRAG